MPEYLCLVRELRVALSALASLLFSTLDDVAVRAKQLVIARVNASQDILDIGPSIYVTVAAKSATLFRAIVSHVVNLERTFIAEPAASALVSERGQYRLTLIPSSLSTVLIRRIARSTPVPDSQLAMILSIVRAVCTRVIIPIALSINAMSAGMQALCFTVVGSAALLASATLDWISHALPASVRLPKEVFRPWLEAFVAQPHWQQCQRLEFGL